MESVRKQYPKRIIILLFTLCILIFSVWCLMRMPGKSYSGQFHPLSEVETVIRDTLKNDIETLATQIGERNVYAYEKLCETAAFIEAAFAESGYEIKRQTYEVDGKQCHNLEVEFPGTSHREEIIVVGAHYDTVWGTPGANDNGTGVAALLTLARAFSGTINPRTLRFVAFVNEEPPFFQTSRMGSLVYANACKQNQDTIVGMMSLETIGYYSEEVNSQHYPFPLSLFYPSKGNFIGFVGNRRSGKLVRSVVQAFRENVKFPSEAASMPGFITGIGWSDQWSFWQNGYHAIMVTDTAPFRYPYYHSGEDTPDKIDYDRLARVVKGLETVIQKLVIPDYYKS